MFVLIEHTIYYHVCRSLFVLFVVLMKPVIGFLLNYHLVNAVVCVRCCLLVTSSSRENSYLPQ